MQERIVTSRLFMLNNDKWFCWTCPVVSATVLRRNLEVVQGHMMVGAQEARVPRPDKMMRTFQRMDLSVTFPHWESHMFPQGLLFVAKLRCFFPF